MQPQTNILTTLESAANQILAAVAPTTVRLARVAVVISDEAETASTDGVVRIRMPVTFCNVSVADEVEVAVGLLVHEIGHFLQPLAEVDTVEQAEAIPRWLTNVALDVQGEALLQSLFPTFKLPLTRVRRVVHRAHVHGYEQEIRQATSFTAVAGSLALWGRFADPNRVFYPDTLPAGAPDESRALGFLQALDGFRACPARLLAERLFLSSYTESALKGVQLSKRS